MVKLRNYQEKGVRQIEHFKGRVLLADEMRLGKTIQVLYWLMTHPEITPVVVVCPTTAKWVWEELAKQHFDMNGIILESTKPPRGRTLYKGRLYIINYEILQYWVDFIKRLKIKLFVTDECHYIKSPRAQCTKAVKKIVQQTKVKYFIATGGTPLKNRPAEMFNVLKLIRPDKFPSFTLYADRYCAPKHKPWGWEYKGATHIDELHKNLSAWCMIRRLRKDVLDEIPKERHVIPLGIKGRKEYQQAETNFIRWLNKRSPARANKAKKAKRLVQMGYLRRLAASKKMNNVIKWIDDFLEKDNSKLAVFAIHKNIIKRLRQKYKNISVVVDGSITGRKRKLAIDTFQKRKRIRMFIGNIKAAGTAIELSKASAVAFVEIEWTPGDLTQVEDRIFEYQGSEAPLIFYLVARETIEEHLCRIVQSKQAVLSNVLDGSPEKNKLNVFDELEKVLLRKRK